MVGFTWFGGLSTPMGQADNDMNRVAFLVLFDIDGEGVDSGGGELVGVAMCLLKTTLIKVNSKV